MREANRRNNPFQALQISMMADKNQMNVGGITRAGAQQKRAAGQAQDFADNAALRGEQFALGQDLAASQREVLDRTKANLAASGGGSGEVIQMRATGKPVAGGGSLPGSGTRSTLPGGGGSTPANAVQGDRSSQPEMVGDAQGNMFDVTSKQGMDLLGQGATPGGENEGVPDSVREESVKDSLKSFMDDFESRNGTSSLQSQAHVRGLNAQAESDIAREREAPRKALQEGEVKVTRLGNVSPLTLPNASADITTGGGFKSTIDPSATSFNKGQEFDVGFTSRQSADPSFTFLPNESRGIDGKLATADTSFSDIQSPTEGGFTADTPAYRASLIREDQNKKGIKGFNAIDNKRFQSAAEDIESRGPEAVAEAVRQIKALPKSKRTELHAPMLARWDDSADGVNK
jgi:hypothetical protein